jgi:subtilisin family serine protease
MLILTLLIVGAVSKKGNAKGNNKKVPNQYLIRFKEDARASDVESTLANLTDGFSARVLNSWKDKNQFANIQIVTNATLDYLRSDLVESYEQDQEYSLAAIQSSPPWGLDRVDQRVRPLDQKYVDDSDGSGVNVYVLDSGIRTTHSEFEGRAKNAYTALDNAEDCNGHGTHVSGIIGGKTYGVAKNVTLWSVKVLDCHGIGTTSTILAGISWIRQNHKKPAVVSMSFEGDESDFLGDFVRALVFEGITVVVAAGNDNDDACNYSPSSIEEVLTVGAINQNDARAPFSNYGSCVDLFAPGVEIPSSYGTSDTAVETISGTSMSVPFVTGAAALVLSKNPTFSPSQVEENLLAKATPAVIVMLDPSSPNLLLFTRGASVVNTVNILLVICCLLITGLQ